MYRNLRSAGVPAPRLSGFTSASAPISVGRHPAGLLFGIAQPREEPTEVVGRRIALRLDADQHDAVLVRPDLDGGDYLLPMGRDIASQDSVELAAQDAEHELAGAGRVQCGSREVELLHEVGLERFQLLPGCRELFLARPDLVVGQPLVGVGGLVDILLVLARLRGLDGRFKLGFLGLGVGDVGEVPGQEALGQRVVDRVSPSPRRPRARLGCWSPTPRRGHRSPARRGP